MVTGPSVTLHVGQLKTATTSLQAALVKSRHALAAHGIVYRPAAGRYHLREALDLIRRDPESARRMSERLQHTSRVVLAHHNAYWPDFVDAARCFSGRTILSAESLSFAAPATARRAAGDLAGVPVRVVVTTRPLSGMVLSSYSELAKRYLMPAPEAFVRGVLDGFLDEGDESRFGWMLVPRLRRVWSPVATDGWVEVPFGEGPVGDYQREFWRAVGIVGLEPPAMPEENPSLPVGATVAWQDHLQRIDRYDPRVDGGTVSALMSANARRRSAPRSRLRLTAETGSLVDACFPHQAGVDSSSADVAALRAHLRQGAPLVEVHPIEPAVPLDDEVAYWRMTLSRRRRIVSARIAVARLLHVRRSAHPDWDRFPDGAPTETIAFPDGADG